MTVNNIDSNILIKQKILDIWMVRTIYCILKADMVIGHR